MNLWDNLIPGMTRRVFLEEHTYHLSPTHVLSIFQTCLSFQFMWYKNYLGAVLLTSLSFQKHFFCFIISKYHSDIAIKSYLAQS